MTPLRLTFFCFSVVSALRDASNATAMAQSGEPCDCGKNGLENNNCCAPGLICSLGLLIKVMKLGPKRPYQRNLWILLGITFFCLFLSFWLRQIQGSKTANKCKPALKGECTPTKWHIGTHCAVSTYGRPNGIECKTWLDRLKNTVGGKVK